MYVWYCSCTCFLSASLSAGGALSTKPPFDPTGTMTAFFVICVFMSPSTSVLKSSGLSDQRIPPLATRPPRRCVPSTRRLDTAIS